MATAASPAQASYKLWYWPGIKGRGEYIRLVFVEAGVEWEEAGTDFQAVVNFCWGGGNTGFPVRAPPALQHGDLVLANTPAITAYLGRKLGLMPEGLEEQALVDSVLAVVTDAVAEGRLAFHPVDFYASHKKQVEESKPFIAQYGTQRLPKYMQWVEEILRRNGATAESGFLIGSSITVADLTVYHFLAAALQHYGEYYRKEDAPLTKAFHDRIAARPRIKAYLGSDRCRPWDTDSMM